MHPSDPTRVDRQLGFRDILDRAMGMTRRHFVAIYPAVAVPLALFGVVMTLPQTWMLRSMQGGAEGVSSDFIMAWLGTVGMGLIYGALFGLGGSAMLAAATAAAHGEPWPMTRAWAWVLRPVVLGTLILSGLLVLIGSMLCLVPGILAAILLAIVVPVMVIEERYGPSAMGRSRDLVRSNPLGRFTTHPGVQLFAIGFVGYLLSYAVSLVVQVPFIIAQQLLMLRSIAEAGPNPDPSALFRGSWLLLQVPQTVLGTLASTVVMLYLSFATALLYREVRRAREGGDLELAMDELGAPRGEGLGARP